MANPEHLEILERGVEAWNEWRKKSHEIQPYLNDADLSGADLSGATFRHAMLGRVNLSHTNLSRADLIGAILNGANLSRSDLRGARLDGASLYSANLSHANLSHANLSYANLHRSLLRGTDFTNSYWQGSTLAELDLSEAKGLETVSHLTPSTIGVDTLYLSAGKIPEAFLRGCGIPDDFIAFIPSHFGIRQAIQFYSCFISYSTRDEEFARRLYSRMRDEHLRVWFAPEDIQGGQKLHEQIERAIQLHDRLLLVLSESSMQSEWVINEIQRARETEIKENRRKLFPITIVDFEKVKAWRRFDADSGKDLAKEVREYFIPDFSNWKDHDAFEKAFDRLLRDLKAEETRP
ncbi:MAG TPA: toll/interleukin-1 receptor domain-containing protein [Pyrinomonadaceae bacterium]|nr:toll/interleukin-1 receptor domain-containing protein [Pyrinomonadaceae bacterium]